MPPPGEIGCNANGSLVRKDLTSGDDVIYLYDGWRRVQDYFWDAVAEAWEPKREYIWGGTYIDELLAFSDDDGGSQRYLVCQQANFNVVATVKASTAAIVEKITYDPYGEATVTVQPSQSATGNVVLFQGREWDDDADLYYFRNRWLSPRLGRFLQRDPVGYEDGADLYECFGGSPVRGLDPTGEIGIGKPSFVIPPGNDCLPGERRRFKPLMFEYPNCTSKEASVPKRFSLKRRMSFTVGGEVGAEAKGAKGGINASFTTEVEISEETDFFTVPGCKIRKFSAIPRLRV